MNCKCNRCNHSMGIKGWGGVLVCDSCYDDLNPTIIKYKAITAKQERALSLEISFTEEKLKELKKRLKLGKEARTQNKPYIEVRLIRP